MISAIDKSLRVVMTSLKSKAPTRLVNALPRRNNGAQWGGRHERARARRFVGGEFHVPTPDQMAYATPSGIERNTNGKTEKQAV